MKLSKFDIAMIVAFVLVLGLGIGGYYYTDGMVDDEKTAAEKVKGEKDALNNADIRPTAANQKQLTENIKSMEEAVTELSSKRLNIPGNPLSEVTLVNPVVWKNGLDLQVKDLTNLARQKAVTLPTPTNYYFGFGRYLRNTPQESTTAILQKQLLAITELTKALFNSEPNALLRVARTQDEDPGDGWGPGSTTPSASGKEDPIPGRAVEGSGGFYKAYPFEISFTGTTNSVRNFLNAVENSKFVFITRSVTIVNSKPGSVTEGDLRKVADTKPAGAAPAIPGAPGAAGADVIVHQRGPEFIFGSEKVTATVRIDLIEWSGVPKAEAGAAAPAGRPKKNTPPAPQ